jgi:biopolymer transport protein ExbB
MSLDSILGMASSLGGPVGVAIILLSVLAATISIAKVIQYHRVRLGRHAPITAALSKWEKGDRDGAYDTARRDRSVLGDVVEPTMRSLIEQPRNPQRARQQGTRAAMEALAVLGKNLRILETIVQAAPMMGLLGTVLGMIDAFSELSRNSGSIDPTQLAGGIWVALITTALGISVAIPFYFISTWLDGRLERERMAMDAAITGVLADAHATWRDTA